MAGSGDPNALDVTLRAQNLDLGATWPPHPMALFGNEIAIFNHGISPQIGRHCPGCRPSKGIFGRIGRRHGQARERVTNVGRTLQGHPKRFHDTKGFARFLKGLQWLGL
jgi:hypothetical protein